MVTSEEWDVLKGVIVSVLLCFEKDVDTVPLLVDRLDILGCDVVCDEARTSEEALEIDTVECCDTGYVCEVTLAADSDRIELLTLEDVRVLAESVDDDSTREDASETRDRLAEIVLELVISETGLELLALLDTLPDGDACDTAENADVLEIELVAGEDKAILVWAVCELRSVEDKTMLELLVDLLTWES